MTKKRKLILSIIIGIIILLLIAGTVIYIFYKPYINAAIAAKKLVDENYNYNLECYIEGITFKDGQYGQYTVYAEGEKSGDGIRSAVYSKDKPYLEVWADKEGEVIFNLRPMCQLISDEIEKGLGITVGNLEIDMNDTYVSLEDVERVIDKDIISIDDFGIKGSGTGSLEYEIELIDSPEEFNVDYDGDDSYFFRLTLLDYGTKVIIGVPKVQKDSFLYVNMEKDDMKLELYFTYDMTENEKVVIPESTFSEEQLDSFGRVYKLWLLGGTVYDKIYPE